MSINDITFEWKGGDKPKSDQKHWGGGGFGLFSKPKVTPRTVGHFRGRVGVRQKVTISDGGRGLGLFSKKSSSKFFRRHGLLTHSQN